MGHQQVPFSHKHHVADEGIDCRYCHTGVETSPDAGLPSTPVRASLASGRPVRWQRIAQLPDYVYFDHSIHIDRGVGCVECHGRIDRMPLTARAKPFRMGFCLDCHRDPSTRLRPASLVTRMEPLPWTSDERRR